ncbi:MAG: hypothetical protein OXG37_01275 [Actinomycetia bacterium]|nr:hypothetical protein [Actinomycetes bacterium]
MANNNEYVVEVTVTSGTGGRVLTASQIITVTVANADEDGLVELSVLSPRVGDTIRATLSDPDGSVTGVGWQWERGQHVDESHPSWPAVWNPIDGETSQSYMASGDDGERLLRAVASYSDGPGKRQSSYATAAVERVEDQETAQPGDTQPGDTQPDMVVSFDSAWYAAQEGGPDAQVVVRLNRTHDVAVEIPIVAASESGYYELIGLTQGRLTIGSGN